LLGDPLQTPGDLCDLLFAVGALVFGFNQLQVVDDHQAQLVAKAQAAADGADLADRATGLIVDEQRQTAEF